jgi:hypothetical protein
VINHEELLTKISKSVIDVFSVLPRTELLLDLYRTPSVRRYVAVLYAKIIKFVIKALNWYNKSKLQHAVQAVVNPYNISFKDIVIEIAECSRRVDELADTLHKVEIRDMNDKVTVLMENNIKLSNTILQQNDRVSEALLGRCLIPPLLIKRDGSI